MSSQVSGESGDKNVDTFITTKPEMEELAFCASDDTSSAINTGTNDAPPIVGSEDILAEPIEECFAASGRGESERKATSVFKLTSKSSHKELRDLKRLTQATTSAFFERRPQRTGIAVDELINLPTTVERWSLAAQAVASFPAIREHQIQQTHRDGKCIHFKSDELLV